MLAVPTVVASLNGAPAQQGSRRDALHREPNTIPGNGRTTRAVMADGQPSAPSAYPTALFTPFEAVTGCEAMYRSAWKCWKGVGRKYSAQAYVLNIIEKTVEVSRELANGTYRQGRTHVVKIEYPKKRTALAISFRDRVFQRSLNDTALYPQMTRSFIYHNLACQRGKGSQKAREEYKAMLHRAFLKYGTNKFQIIECDIKGYYDNMRHDEVDRLFVKHCDPWTAETASRTLRSQYRGEVGYNPGSQMVQIAGISYLDEFDHFVKETLREKMYLHYMDDTRTIEAPDADCAAILSKMAGKLAEVGLAFHPRKTRVVTADKGGLFLGFVFRVTPSGKVLMLRDPDKVKDNRRHLRRLAGLVRRGRRTVEDFENCYGCIRACISEGNSVRLIRNMDNFVNELRREINES